jgi:TRAP-type C4-dicarboxylate transport system substrate-binding protein
MRAGAFTRGLVLATALGAAVPVAAEEIDATVVAGHPPVFLWVKTLTEAFIPAVDQALEGSGHSINWTEAYGGTLAKVGGELEAIEAGLAQVAIVSSLFEPSLLPLQNITYVTPFGSQNVDIVFDTVDRMHDEIPAMRAAWERYDMEYLGGGFGLEDYMLMTNFPVDSLDDLEGRKINAPGPAVNWLEGTGAVGVSGNLTTYYNDLQTGVTEGVVVFPTAAAPAKLQEVAKYLTRTHFGAQYAGAIVAKKSWLETLPPEVQEAIRDGVKAFAAAYREGLEQRVAAAYETLEANGAEISELSDEVRAEWASALPDIAGNWAADLDAKGEPGSEVLKVYMDHLRAAGADLPRQWDQD